MLYCAVFGLGSWLGVPAAPPSFAEIWYREVVLGEVAWAAEQYEQLYLGSGHDKVGAETRQKAAFRAGLCHEKLGRLENASRAYVAVAGLGAAPERSPAPAAPAAAETQALFGPELALRAEALWRARALASRSGATAKESGGAAEPQGGAGRGALGAEGSVHVSVAVALEKLMEGLRGLEKGRDELVAKLDLELALRRQRIRDLEETLERLARRGASLSFPGDAPGSLLPAASLVEELKGAMPQESEFPRVVAALAERFLARALQAIEGKNGHRALSFLAPAWALSQGHSGEGAPRVGAASAEWSQRLLEGKMSAGDLAAVAGRQLQDEDLKRRAAARRELDAIWRMAADFAGRGRIDLAMEPLSKARTELDWSQPAMREDPEIAALAARGDQLLLAVGGLKGEELVSRRHSRGREQAESLLDRAEELVVLITQEGRWHGPAALAGGDRATQACHWELERLLDLSKGARERGELELLGRWRSAAAQLLAWVPGADPNGDLRRRLEALHEEAAASPRKQ